MRVALRVDDYAAATAVEVVDLALAAGLLEVPVDVFFRAAGLRHLLTEDPELVGRWRTLLDFCPARLLVAAGEQQPWRDSALAEQVTLLPENEFEAQLQQCDHILQG
ncbi:MAG: hypothetical protein Tsb002_15980 [Wenzhouxiangellaceae bacterium]